MPLFASKDRKDAKATLEAAVRLLHEQRDILKPEAITAFQAAIDTLRNAIRSRLGDPELRNLVAATNEAAHTHLKAYPNPGARENILEFQSTLVKVFALFVFFLQPMVIPSGSAQPTLYGVTYKNALEGAPFEMPGFVTRIWDLVIHGHRYYHIIAKTDGQIDAISEVEKVMGVFKRQRFRVGPDIYSAWFPPENFPERARLRPGTPVKAGQPIIKLRVTSGDHLLVDRFTYNFRRPVRGETIVFTSTGVPGLIQNTHYIKRLIALEGERVRIGNDRHVIINGKRLDNTTPGFRNVYTFSGPPVDSEYSGHVNDVVGQQFARGGIAPLFADESVEYVVGPKRYLAFGDNTMNSHDGRAWGDFPQDKVVGKAACVFWPFSKRFPFGFE